MDFLVFALVFAAACLMVYAVLNALFGARKQMARRLRDVADYTVSDDSAGSVKRLSMTERVREEGAGVAGRIAAVIRRSWPQEYRERVRHQLARAGRPATDVDAFLSSKIAYAVVAAGAIWVLGTVLRLPAAFTWLLVIATAILGFTLPDSRVKESIKKRQGQVIRELPDVLDMLTISVTAGLGFDQALAKLVKSADGAVASEFDRVLREVNAGASRKQAMRAMADRVDMPELSSFVASVLQAETFGTPIAGVLRAQSVDLRLKRRQRAEEEAQKAPVKMTVPLMLIVLPATILILLGPALISLSSVFRK